MNKNEKQRGYIHVIQYEGTTKDGQQYHQFETHAEGSRQTLIDCMCTLVSYLADSGDTTVGEIIGEMLFRCAYLKMKETTGGAFYEKRNSASVKLDPEAAKKIKEILKRKEKDENGNSET